MKYKKLSKIDLASFKDLLNVFIDVFEMKNFNMPNDIYLKRLLLKEDFLVFVVLDKDKIIGGLTAYLLQQCYNEKPLVYIYDLAIMTKYQRQGIGKKLIDSIVQYSKDNEFDELFVQAEVIDDYAVEFYKSTGGNPEIVVSFSYKM